MSSIRELQRLQGLDSELASCREMLKQIQRQLEDTAALHELRERVPAKRHKVAELERQQRAAEWEVEATREHVKSEEGKLYGGKINNPKELVALQEEATLLKTRQRQQEDLQLQVMAQLEEQQALLAGLAQDLVRAEEERQELEVRLTAQRQQLEVSVQELGVQWEATAALVSHKDRELYGALLSTKQGKALARVERAMCQGCRINLPMTIQQRVRTDQGLVQCPSCGRILFMD